MSPPVRRSTAAVVGLALVLATLAAVPAAAAPENLAITNVTVTPDPPAPGEPFTVEVTIENKVGGNGSVEINTLYVRRASGLPEYERLRNLGSIGDGQFITVPVQLSLSASTNLRVFVHARSTDGENVQLEYPLYVTVEEPDDVQLSFSSPDAVVGVATGLNVTVANGDTSPVSNLELTLAGGSATVRNARRASASIDSADERTYAYTVRFAAAGTHTLTATLDYTTSEGYERRVTDTVTVEAEPPVVDADLTAGVTTVESTPAIATSLTNYGNTPLTDVVVRAEVDGRTYARTVVDDVGPRSSRAVTLEASGVPPGAVTVVAAYEAAGEPRRTSTSVAYTAAVALEATVGDGTSPPVTVDVLNLGRAPLSDVALRLLDGDRVVAHRLVGSVPAGTTRSVTVNVSGLDDTTLDARATYRVGPVTGEATTAVDYRRSPGRIELTGVQVEPAGGTLRISGSASNVGLSSVQSLVVRVLPADGVDPVPPNREYFVGTVPASDFVSFDLTARVEPGVTAVPVEVSYLVDGAARTERLSVPVERLETPVGPTRPATDGLLVPVVVGGVVVLAVGGLIYLGWRNRGGR